MLTLQWKVKFNEKQTNDESWPYFNYQFLFKKLGYNDLSYYKKKVLFKQKIMKIEPNLTIWEYLKKSLPHFDINSRIVCKDSRYST